MKQYLVLMLSLISISLSAQSELLTFAQAKKIAAEEEQKILMVFSGSDWCKPCIQLKKDLLESTEFKAIEDQMVFLYLDFPYKKQNKLSAEEQARNEMLAEEYNEQGQFPKVVLVNAIGEVIDQIKYEKSLTAKVFVDLIKDKTK